MFGSKYLDALQLDMPTMKLNKGDDEDSDFEETILIGEREIAILAHARQMIKFTKNQPSMLVTIELIALAKTEFFGLRVVQFNQANLQEDGFFIFIDTEVWKMSEKQ